MNIKLQTNEQLSVTVANGLAGVFVNGVSLSASLSSKADLTAFQNYYAKSETSSSSQISNELKKYQLSGNYLSSNALDNYYQKSETSSATELASELADKLEANDVNISYDSTARKIVLESKSHTTSVDCNDFIKDGMLSSAELCGTTLVLKFNTDAGSEPISVELSNFVDNYDSKIETLSNAIDKKIFIQNNISSISGYSDLSVVKLSADEYNALLTSNQLLSNALYIVEDDYVDAYGEQIKNVAYPTDLSDAATKGYVDDALSNVQIPTDLSAFSNSPGYATSGDLSSKRNITDLSVYGYSPWIVNGTYVINWDNAKKYWFGYVDSGDSIMITYVGGQEGWSVTVPDWSGYCGGNIDDLSINASLVFQSIVRQSITGPQSGNSIATTQDIPKDLSSFTNSPGYTTNIGTITGITMNGASKGTSGNVNLGTVLTAHQSLANYYGKTETSSATEISNELKKYQLSGNYLSSNALDNYYQMSETSSAAEISTALANAGGGKVYFDNRISGVAGSDDLSVVKLSADEYAQMLDDGTCLSNAIYIVEAPNIDAFKQRITNVAPATDLSDAVNLAQLNAVSANAGTITGITMNGTSKGTSGVVNLGTVLTAHQSLANYYKKTETSSAAQISTAIEFAISGLSSEIEKKNSIVFVDWED